MTKEDKELLFKDLCTRLPYGVICEFKRSTLNVLYNNIYDDTLTINNIEYVLKDDSIVRPYLRPMSSMTEKERDEFEDESNCWFFVNEDGEIFPMGRLTDSGQFECGILSGFRYLLENHFDYHDLISKGLALETKPGMYNLQ